MISIPALTLAILWIEVRPRKADLFQRKPLNCELCMAFWLTFAIEWHIDLNTLTLAATTALAAPVTLNLYNKVQRWLMK